MLREELIFYRNAIKYLKLLEKQKCKQKTLVNIK